MSYTNPKSKRYFCCRRCRLPQRMCRGCSPNSPQPSARSGERALYWPPPRLNIIFDLEMVFRVDEMNYFSLNYCLYPLSFLS